jgi:hypothetical protein
LQRDRFRLALGPDADGVGFSPRPRARDVGIPFGDLELEDLPSFACSIASLAEMDWLSRVSNSM